MSTLLAFMKKEWTENVRNSRLILLVIIFILFGIMNPAIAKLIPWLMRTMADSLEENGERWKGFVQSHTHLRSKVTLQSV